MTEKLPNELEKFEYDITGLDPDKQYLLKIKVDSGIPLSYIRNLLEHLKSTLDSHNTANIIVLPVCDDKVDMELLKVIEDTKK